MDRMDVMDAAISPPHLRIGSPSRESGNTTEGLFDVVGAVCGADAAPWTSVAMCPRVPGAILPAV